MPRQSRLDAPGLLQHVMARGIERREIFKDDKDRKSFLDRLAQILEETQTQCYAWALIPNHFHLLLRTSLAPLSKVMRRLMTGYAVTFNKRHKRTGHLFQNRPARLLRVAKHCGQATAPSLATAKTPLFQIQLTAISHQP